MGNISPKTNYAALSGNIDGLIADATAGGFSACVPSLLHIMAANFPALMRQHNPVVMNLESWTQLSLAFIIQEYSGFSNAAIHMFLEARIRNRWPALTKEIMRNMDEEMGALSQGVPHLELMRHGYRRELGIETDGLRYTAVTEDFINRMNGLFRDSDNTFLAGVLLAFEATAVDEFRIVERILRRYKELIGGEITDDSLTGQYIAGHVMPGTPTPDRDPEMDHYRGMVDAVGGNVDDGNLRPLVQGFFSVCLELNRWWEQIALEAIQKEIRDQLKRNGAAPQEPYPSFAQAGIPTPGRILLIAE
ncbi:MAG: DUF3865 domain-containing protein [Acidobacteriota bacterium]|nr:DUF3865 domain-containing protein [Acidobacteriota bacterium]